MNLAFHNPARRCYQASEDACLLRSVFCAPAFHKGSKSEQNPTTNSASGQGQNANGTQSQNIASGSIGVGSGGKYLEQGAADTNVKFGRDTAIQANQSTVTKTLLGGSDLSGNKGTLNITDNGAVKSATDLAGTALADQSTAFQQALGALSDLANQTSTTTNALAAQQSSDLGKLLDSVNQANTSAHDSLTNLTGGVLGSINQDIATAAAGSTAMLQKAILWIGVALVGVLGMSFYFSRKHN